MTLAELVADLERRAILADAEGATAPVGNVYRVVVADLRPLTETAESNGSSPPAPERLLTPAEVAERLGVGVRFVYAHRQELGGRALSKRALRFPEGAIARYLARRP